jgi:hypothetical protein
VTFGLRAANLALRFFLELSALASTAYWGYGVWWPLAVAAPAAVIVVWALLVAPKAKVAVARPVAFAIELGVWTAAAAALAGSGQGALAIAFAIVAPLSGLLNYVWSG